MQEYENVLKELFRESRSFMILLVIWDSVGKQRTWQHCYKAPSNTHGVNLHLVFGKQTKSHTKLANKV